MTEEQRQARRDNLARARKIQAEKRQERESAREAGAENMAAKLTEEETPAVPVERAPDILGWREDEAEAAEAPVEEPDLTPFQRFVVSLDSETRELLSDDDLIGIWEEQQAKARAEKKAAVKKAATERALIAARIEEGVIAPKTAAEIAWKRRMEEPVEFTVRMPIGGGIADAGFQVGPVDIGLRWDGQIYEDGKTYVMPRARYESMRSALFIAHQNELLFEGKGLHRRVALTRMAMHPGERLN